MHFKYTDTAGEDGDFARKVAVLEDVDAAIGRSSSSSPTCLMITGDHSTPALMAAHSWHPVPFLLRSRLGRADDVREFSERPAGGSLGTFPAKEAMPLALAHAGGSRSTGRKAKK